MKKIILSIAAIMAFGFVNAQDIKYGVKAGLNNSNFTNDGSGGDANSGFYVGGLLDYSVSEKFHVQPELLYSIEGAKDAKLNYLRIPIMAKYYIMDGLSLQAGPELAFKAGGDASVKDNAKSMDYGIGIGAGYELSSGLMFDTRYNLGMANIADGGGTVKNTSISFGLGYRF